MLEKAKKILYSIPYHEVEEFYTLLIGETLNNKNEGCRYHIYSKLKHCHRWYRLNHKKNINNAITLYIIRTWLMEMNNKYNLNTTIKIPNIDTEEA